jgi:hypothetical protein
MANDLSVDRVMNGVYSQHVHQEGVRFQGRS